MYQVEFQQKLFKCCGVLWQIKRIVDKQRGEEQDWQVHDAPLCPTSACHSILIHRSDGLYCEHCDRQYEMPMQASALKEYVERKWWGFTTSDYEVVSLDLPPTAVVDEDHEDARYWIQARLGEKNGKRMAVVYIGEKMRDQSKGDYVQLFIDIEDEQLRFDRGNKTPLKLLTRLQAEFPNSSIVAKRAGGDIKEPEVEE